MGNPATDHASGPLTRHPGNPRYFADGRGDPVYLTGSHTWSEFQDMLGPSPAHRFDYDAYLDWIVDHAYNFFSWLGVGAHHI